MQHHWTVPDKFGRWVLASRGLILTTVLLITGAAVWASLRVPVRATILEGFMSDQTEFLEYRHRAAAFGGTTDDVIYAASDEGDALWTPEKLDAIRAAAIELESLPAIARVQSLPDAPWIRNRPLGASEVIGVRIARGRLLSGRELPDPSRYAPPLYWPEYADEQELVDLQEVRAAALQDDLIAGVLVSRDGRCQAMVIQLAADADVAGAAQLTLRKDIERIFEAHQLGARGVHTSGVLISQGWMLGEGITSMLILFPVGVLVTSLLIYCVFGRITLVLLTMFISVIAAVWAVGATSAVFGEITIFVAAMPLLVLVIATADTVHLASAYMAEVESGVPRDEALLKVIRDVGGACVLTSVTTGVGFLSLMVVPAATVRHAALAAAVGVAAALLLALTLVPVVLSWFPIRPRDARGSTGWINNAIDRVVAVCREVTTARPRAVLAVLLLLMAGSCWAALGIQADADFSRRFNSSHPHRKAVDFFARNLAGANAVEVYLQTDPERLLEPETLRAIDRFQQRLTALDKVEWSTSVVSMLRLIGDVVMLDTPDRLPPTRAVAERMLGMMETTGASPKSVVLPEDGLTRIIVRVAPTRIFKVLDVTHDIEALAAETLPPYIKVEASGMYPIIGRAAIAIIENQLMGFLLCFFFVMLIVTVGVRSIKLGMLAVAPNLFPLTLLAGALALLVPLLDTDVLGIAIVSFGLAVDDTIHFLHRYDIERTRTGDPRQAIVNTYNYTGQAIVRTTLILGIGLSPFALSSYLSIWMMGTYLVFVLATAVFGDLLMLPALILVFSRQKPPAQQLRILAADPSEAPAA